MVLRVVHFAMSVATRVGMIRVWALSWRLAPSFVMISTSERAMRVRVHIDIQLRRIWDSESHGVEGFVSHRHTRQERMARTEQFSVSVGRRALLLCQKLLAINSAHFVSLGLGYVIPYVMSMFHRIV